MKDDGFSLGQIFFAIIVIGLIGVSLVYGIYH